MRKVASMATITRSLYSESMPNERVWGWLESADDADGVHLPSPEWQNGMWWTIGGQCLAQRTALCSQHDCVQMLMTVSVGGS